MCFWTRSSPGVLRTWIDHSWWEACLANDHLKSSAVRVLKHFRISCQQFGGFYRLGLLSTKGGQSVSEGALEVKSESHISFCGLPLYAVVIDSFENHWSLKMCHFA